MELVLLILIALAVGVLLKAKPKLVRGPGRDGQNAAPTFRHVTGTVTGLSNYAKDDADHTTEVAPDGTVTQKIYHNTTIIQNLFILSEDGMQTPLRMSGLEIPIADGQAVTVSYGDFPKTSRPLFLKNHASGRTYRIFHTPLDIAVGLGVVRSGFDIILTALAICVGVAAFGWLVLGSAVWAVLAVVSLPLIILAMLMHRKARMTAFRALLSSEEAAVSATQVLPKASA